MVHVASRGDVPVRLGPGVKNVPDYGPSKMSVECYRDPVQFVGEHTGRLIDLGAFSRRRTPASTSGTVMG